LKDAAVLRAIWSYYSPFGAFKDASRGTLAERAAACRHNCRMRSCLRPYMSRWLVSCSVAFLLTAFFDALSPHDEAAVSVFVILATANAVFASTAICAVFVLAYAYVSLAHDAARLRNAGQRH
jgi:hypothetical protein